MELPSPGEIRLGIERVAARIIGAEAARRMVGASDRDPRPIARPAGEQAKFMLTFLQSGPNGVKVPPAETPPADTTSLDALIKDGTPLKD